MHIVSLLVQGMEQSALHYYRYGKRCMLLASLCLLCRIKNCYTQCFLLIYFILILHHHHNRSNHYCRHHHFYRHHNHYHHHHHHHHQSINQSIKQASNQSIDWSFITEMPTFGDLQSGDRFSLTNCHPLAKRINQKRNCFHFWIHSPSQILQDISLQRKPNTFIRF